MQLHIRHARDNTAKRGRRKRKTDCGGGIDIGKAVAAVATNGRSSWDYAALETRPYEEVAIPPLLPIAVPTTIRAATGKWPDGKNNHRRPQQNAAGACGLSRRRDTPSGRRRKRSEEVYRKRESARSDGRKRELFPEALLIFRGELFAEAGMCDGDQTAGAFPQRLAAKLRHAVFRHDIVDIAPAGRDRRAGRQRGYDFGG